MAEAGGRPESAAAALSALLHFLDRPTVDLLRQVLEAHIVQALVRLVDRLAELGYVQRGPGDDGRSTSVSLTEAGRTAAETVAAWPGRECFLARSTACRPRSGDAAQAHVQDAGRADPGAGAVRWMCRLCDTGICRGAEGGCPVGRVRARRGVRGSGRSALQPHPADSVITGLV